MLDASSGRTMFWPRSFHDTADSGPYCHWGIGWMFKSKLGTRGRTTIPQGVRRALRLAPGDRLNYVLEGGRTVIAKHSPSQGLDPFIAFQEWDSEADRSAYRNL